MPERMPPWRQPDDILLATLGDALSPPSPGEATTGLDGLLDALALQATRPTRRGLPSALGRRARGALVGAAAGLLVATCSAVGAGASLPRPLRALAAQIGLPVTPSAVARLHGAMAELARDLQAGSGADATQLARDIGAVGDALAALDPHERAVERPAAERLLGAACGTLAARPVPVPMPAVCAVVVPARPADAATSPWPRSARTRDGGGEAAFATRSGSGVSAEGPPEASTGPVATDGMNATGTQPDAGTGTTEPIDTSGATTADSTTTAGSTTTADSTTTAGSTGDDGGTQPIGSDAVVGSDTSAAINSVTTTEPTTTDG